jgi:endonuclease YncB( thermonuclease family)
VRPGRIVPLVVAALVACGHPAVQERPSVASPAARVRVARIVDAERWVLRTGGRLEKVRLIGVDARFAPALGCARSAEPIADLIGGDPLRIERDSRAEDATGRAWVWLWSGDELINASVLRAGIATLARYWPNQRNETALLRAQLSAARGERGLWDGCVALRRVVATDGSDRRCDPSYPGRCVPPFPPDLDCDEIRYANFVILGPDLHDLDGDGDGLGCERFNPM